MLMTASGLDTRPESKDAPYPGPHVGSYPNMLLKRCILSLPCPKVIFCTLINGDLISYGAIVTLFAIVVSLGKKLVPSPHSQLP